MASPRGTDYNQTLNTIMNCYAVGTGVLTSRLARETTQIVS